jgi:hypothetical protein
MRNRPVPVLTRVTEAGAETHRCRDEPRHVYTNPAHPTPRRNRRALEHSLNGIPADALVRERLHTRLAEVAAEEECRVRLQQALAR